MKNSLRYWKNAASKWVNLLHLWDYEVIYAVKPMKEPETGCEESTFCTLATFDGSPRYKQIVLTGNENYIKEAEDKDIDKKACHEAIHAVIAPLDDVAVEMIGALPTLQREGWDSYRRHMLESVTTHLTNVIQHLHKSPKGR